MTKLELLQRLQAALKTIEQLRSENSVLKGMLNMAKMTAQAHEMRASVWKDRATEIVAGGR